jgi:hypothetical protein
MALRCFVIFANFSLFSTVGSFVCGLGLLCVRVVVALLEQGAVYISLF